MRKARSERFFRHDNVFDVAKEFKAPFTAFSAVVASINNTGPGLGQVGPSTTFTSLNDFQTWVCTFAMLLGRLEIFTLLVVLTPAFWRK